MKKQYYNSSWKNKKAFIFTLDVMITLVIVFLFLAAATTFVTKSNKDSFPNLQLIKYGVDVMRVLDYRELLKNPDEVQLSNKLQTVMSSNYKIQIEGSNNGNCYFLVGDTPPEDQFIGSGKYYFRTDADNFCYARFKLWLG